MPVAGDYVVTQEDGYQYLNPKEVFERKYSPVGAPQPLVTDEMVARFLSWRLPDDFAPDGGMEFKVGEYFKACNIWPTGTNLLNAQQARAMLEHVLGRSTNSLTFGIAIDAMKLGHRVARAGWNGKGMWLALVKKEVADKVAFEFAALDAAPWIGMKTADEKFVPWLASQTDMLAEDWVVLQ